MSEPPPKVPLRLVCCRRCHRPLWTAEARAREIGDDRAEAEFAARQGGIKQETLPGV